MTLTIEFTPAVETWINGQADQLGLEPAEVVRQLVEKQAPNDFRKPTVTEQRELQRQKNQAMIDLLRRWREEDATDDEEELARRDAENAELMRNLEANRVNFLVPEI